MSRSSRPINGKSPGRLRPHGAYELAQEEDGKASWFRTEESPVA